MIHSSGVFIDLMMPMVIMMSSVAVLIFFVVMYLMLSYGKIGQRLNISVKIFGYRKEKFGSCTLMVIYTIVLRCGNQYTIIEKSHGFDISLSGIERSMRYEPEI